MRQNISQLDPSAISYANLSVRQMDEASELAQRVRAPLDLNARTPFTVWSSLGNVIPEAVYAEMTLGQFEQWIISFDRIVAKKAFAPFMSCGDLQRAPLSQAALAQARKRGL